MSQPLLELQRLLAGRQTTTGRVVAVAGGMARVATAHGVVEVTESGVEVGNRVVIRDGLAVKMQETSGNQPHLV